MKIKIVVMLCVAGVMFNASGAKKKVKKPPVSLWVKMMTVDMKAPVKKLKPLKDTGKRKKVFAQRNSPAAVKQLADELFVLWDWKQRKSSPFKITRRLDPMKKHVIKLYRAKKYQAALDAFRAYFFAKVRLLWKDEKGLTSRDFEARAKRDYMIKNVNDNVNLLMRNIYQAKMTKKTVSLGDMGALRWDWIPDGQEAIWYTSIVFEYFGKTECRKLWWKFVDTKDPKYLKKYLEYLDDYNLNYRFQEELNPLNLDFGKQGLNDAESFIFMISEVSRLLPEDGKGFPSTTLARALIRQLSVIIPQSVYYNREQSNNHSCGAIHVMLSLSNYLYDFKLAPILVNESRRQFEAYGTLNSFPDGSFPARATGYSRHEFHENSIYVKRLEPLHLKWFTPQLHLQYKNRLFRRAYWYLNMFSPGGEGSNGLCGDRRNQPFSMKVDSIADYLPDAFKNKALQAVTNRIMQNQTKPDWRGIAYMAPNAPLLQEGLGSKITEPPYTSMTFPYNCTSFMRSSWDEKNGQYGIFLAGTGRGRDGGLFRRAKNTCSLTITAFDQWLLVNGTEKIYNYVRSPIQVDGLDQFARAGLTGLSRKGENNEGLVKISPWRYHHSKAFDVAEAEYDGPYSNTYDHEPILYNFKENLKNLKQSISGISHKRIVQFVKEHGVWIVLDVMDSKKPHTYKQQWWVSKLTKKNPDGYVEKQFTVDKKAQTIKSSAKDKVNISMYYCSPMSLQIAPVKKYIKQEEWFKGYRADRNPGVEFLHLAADWKSTGGKSQLITVIYPRKKLNDDITVNRAEDGKSVAIKLKNGTKIDFSANGMETNLTVTEVDGKKRGIVVTDSASYEFEKQGWFNEKRTPIYRPIEDLTITPGVAAFIDSIDVGISCPDKDVDIRYTIDGSDPTLDSPLYNGKIKFDGSVQIKARAFRKSLKSMPADLVTGTMMSRVFRADFTKVMAHDPLPEKYVKKLKQGLKYYYYENQRPKLLYGAMTTKVKKRGTVKSLFDTTPKSDKKNQAFAFRYEGYFKAPKDGLYTIYAPEEFTHYAPLCGYDLDFKLGWQNLYYRGKKRAVAPGKPLQQWYPVTGRHAFGTWSVYLKKGYHPISVYFADIRPGGFLEYMQFKYKGTNVPGLIERYYEGKVPGLKISGPGINKQTVPANLLFN